MDVDFYLQLTSLQSNLTPPKALSSFFFDGAILQSELIFPTFADW